MEMLSKLNKKQLQELYDYLTNYEVKYRDNLDLKASDSFGVEIEFDGIPRTKVEESLQDTIPLWYIHQDNSIQTYKDGYFCGGEISSAVLHDTKEDWLMLELVMQTLQALNAYASKSTAFHIHVGTQILESDINNAKNLIKLWCSFEDIIYHFGYNEEIGIRNNLNIFAPPLLPTYQKILKKYPHYLEECSSLKMFDFGKRQALNFHNAHYLDSMEELGNTLEVRTPNGTMNYIVAQNYINFFLKLMEYASSENFDLDLINHLFKKSLKGNSDVINTSLNIDMAKALLLSDLIFVQELDKLNFLKQYGRNDFRLMRQKACK